MNDKPRPDSGSHRASAGDSLNSSGDSKAADTEPLNSLTSEEVQALSEAAESSDDEAAIGGGNNELDRGDVIGIGGRWLSDWALRLVILAAAGWVIWMALDTLWIGVLPILLALIVSTVLWPVVRFLTNHKVPYSVASLIALVGGLGAVAGALAAISPSIISQTPELADKSSDGIERVRDWLQGPPLNIQDEQLNTAVDGAVNKLQDSSTQIADGVFSGVFALGSFLVTMVMVLVLTFFFIKDGRHFLPFIRRVAGQRAGRHLVEVLTRSWNTLGGFIRAQALVSLIDAVFISIGLVFLGVPMALALGVITFLGGFIPIVGAFTAGAIAVLVALVANGFTTALIVLALIIVVQQLEGNILQPILQSKSMNLHPVIILLAVAAGSGLYGIVGAFLAVPIAAIVAVVLRYLSEQTDLRSGHTKAKDVNALTSEGQLTAWFGEIGGRKLRNVRRTKRDTANGPDNNADMT